MGIVFVLANPKEGTKYIAHMLQPIPNSYVRWEPDTQRLRANYTEIAKWFHKGDDSALEEFWKRKLDFILKSNRINRLHFESDFRFIMVWAKYALRDIPDFKVVFMDREPALIAASLAWAGFGIDKNKGGLGTGFLLQPGQPRTTYEYTGSPDDSVAKMIWHTFEINELKRRFMIDNPQVPVFHFHLQYNRDTYTFKRLFKFLGVPHCSEVIERVKEDPVMNSWKRLHKHKHLASIEEVYHRVSKYEMNLKQRR